MKKLPLGIQSFRKIVEGNHVYVDKTEHIYNLIGGASCYFLSRPRRFGKSLLLDTIGEVFGGEKELFKGLWIYDSLYDFPKHPVIRLDMSNIANKTPEVLENSIMLSLQGRIQDEGFDIEGGIPSHMFTRLIELLHRKHGQRVVVLIDEYDKPILDHITDYRKADANREVLRNFYGILKSMDAHLRFIFITGVSKFTKTSIFSGLNHLSDITLNEKYANICGIPIDSLDTYFSEHIVSLRANKRFQGNTNLKESILAWYDGYSWDGETKLLNPFSLLNFFDQEKLSSFWFSSGSPRFLMELIKSKPESYMSLNNTKISEDMLDSIEIEKITVEPLLFQTGYLTVDEIRFENDDINYVLKIPNNEVRRAFNLHILSALTESSDVSVGRARTDIAEALKSGDLEQFLYILRGLFASIPYNLHVNTESYYHSIFYAAMNVLGLDMDVEVSVSRGKVDAIIEIEDKAYIMEFKYKNCPTDASGEEKRKLFDAALGEGMEQIETKGYADKYKGSGKQVYKTAFAFLGRDEIELRVES